MKLRERDTLSLALAAAGATLAFDGLVGLDPWVSGLFFADGRFPADGWWPVRALYHAVPWLSGGLLLAALALLLAAAWRPGRVPRWLWRRSAALLLVAVVGAGVVVHALLKEGWGRPRPDEVQLFGGAHPFVPALQPGGPCARNCSFVSGHASAGFCLMALGLFGSPATRRRWLRIGLTAGLAVGLLRVAQGRHFASDVVFCGLVIWLCSQGVRQAWLHARLGWRRWQRARAPQRAPAAVARSR